MQKRNFFWWIDKWIHTCVYTQACTYVHTMLIPTTVVLLVQILALPLRSSDFESLHFLASQICHWWNSDPIAYPSVSSWGLNHCKDWHNIWLMLPWWHLYYERFLFPMSLERTRDARPRDTKHQCTFWHSVWYRSSCIAPCLFLSPVTQDDRELPLKPVGERHGRSGISV